MPTAPRRPVFPTAVFLGDSVTTGGRSLSHPRNRWTSLVCEHLRWREVNLAADGMGFFVRRGGHLPGGGRSPSCRDSTWLETAVRAEPDVLTVCLGLSDAAALPSHLDLVRRAVGHDLEFLARRLRGGARGGAPHNPPRDRGPPPARGGRGGAAVGAAGGGPPPGGGGGPPWGRGPPTTHSGLFRVGCQLSAVARIAVTRQTPSWRVRVSQ